MDYRALYELLGEHTPLKFDCGRLCSAACCAEDEKTGGMYLFPGEAEVLGKVEGYTFSSMALQGYGEVTLLKCAGKCDRALRPLACRLFPLALDLSGDEPGLITDPRGRAVCPLCHKDLEALSVDFVQAVAQVYEKLLQEEECARFLRALSREQEGYDHVL